MALTFVFFVKEPRLRQTTQRTYQLSNHDAPCQGENDILPVWTFLIFPELYQYNDHTDRPDGNGPPLILFPPGITGR
jgi:hypothetical protein